MTVTSRLKRMLGTRLAAQRVDAAEVGGPGRGDDGHRDQAVPLDLREPAGERGRAQVPQPVAGH